MELTKVHGLIFDIDGTLLDSNDAHALAWKGALEQNGFPVPFEKVRAGIGMGSDHFLPALVGIGEKTAKGQTIAEEKDRIFKSELQSALRPFPGAKDLVLELKRRGFALAVATSASKRDMDAFLDRIGVADEIKTKISADDAERTKPDPDLVSAALRALDLKPHEVVMVGDTPYDIEAARRAGVRTIAFRSGGWGDEELGGAAAVYEGPADLLRNLDASPLSERA